MTDGGFARHRDIEQLGARDTWVFAPVVTRRNKERDRYAPRHNDSPALADWRQRTGSDTGKLI